MTDLTEPHDHTPTAPATEPPRLTRDDHALADALGGAAEAINALRKLTEGHPARAAIPEADALVSRLCEFPIGSTTVVDQGGMG